MARMARLALFTCAALAIVTDNKLGNATLPVSAIFLGSGIGGSDDR